MAERVTAQHARTALQSFARALGRPYGHYEEQPDGSYKAIIGALALDYNPLYGGCVISEITSDGGATTLPFGSERVSPREFLGRVRFAMLAMRETIREVNSVH